MSAIVWASVCDSCDKRQRQLGGSITDGAVEAAQREVPFTQDHC